MTDKKLFGDNSSAGRFFERAGSAVTDHWLLGYYHINPNYKPYTTFGQFARGAIQPISSFVLNVMMFVISACVGILSALSLGVGAAIFGVGKLLDANELEDAGSTVATHSKSVCEAAGIHCLTLMFAFVNAANTTRSLATSSYATVAGWFSKDNEEAQNRTQCTM